MGGEGYRYMNTKTNFITALGLSVGLVAMAFVLVAIHPPVASAESNKTAPTAKKADAPKKSQTYNYVAQPGDSYTQMVRKATQTYGIVHKVKLSNAQIIYIETNMTEAAGSPALEIGQKVPVNTADVLSWIENANKLDPQTIAAWQTYVPTVNFNTDHVGQS